MQLNVNFKAIMHALFDQVQSKGCLEQNFLTLVLLIRRTFLHSQMLYTHMKIQVFEHTSTHSQLHIQTKAGPLNAMY